MDYLIFSDVTRRRRGVGAVAGRQRQRTLPDSGGGSSADEVDNCLSVVEEVEGLAVAEATGPKKSERTAGAEAPGSD